MSLVRCSVLRHRCSFWCGRIARAICAFLQAGRGGKGARAAFYPVRHRHGARVKIPAVSAPQAHFEVAEDAVKLSLEQEEQVTTQINALLSMAKAESDYTADNFLQLFVKEQLEEVSSMGQLLRVVQRAGEGNLLRVEEILAREKDSRFALSKEE